MRWEVLTYAVCGGDDDGTGDEGQAVIHADLQGRFPARTREPDALRTACCGAAAPEPDRAQFLPCGA